MALATKCPHCNTIFRVAADQLKLRGGIVRCGACNEVFDGNAALVEPAAKPTPVIPEVVISAAAPAEEYIHGAPVDFDLDYLVAEAETEAEAVEPEPEAVAQEPAPAEAPPAPAVWRTAAAQPEEAAADDEPELTAAEPAPEPEPEPEPAFDPEPEPQPETEPEPEPIPHFDSPAKFAEEAPATGHHGRIEPSFDTPQEHIVAAALDDLHHFDDLEESAQPTPQELHAAALAELHHLGHEAEPQPEPEQENGQEPDDGPAPETTGAQPARDETALHAIAAVNTDARDDGESIAVADEPVFHSAPAPKENTKDGEVELDHEELGFVRRANRSEKYGRTARLAMIAGAPLLVLALLLQAATTFRNTLAANYPGLKPALETTCALLGCKIELPTQLDALSIEQGELQTVADNTFSFTTTLRNQSRTNQTWPHIELVLNDSADKPVLRRVFAPRDYLSAADAAKGFGARSEQTVKLYFELSQLKASGYHIAIFYP